MGTTIAFLQEQAQHFLSGGAGTIAGKLIGSVAGILLLAKVLQATFYVVKTGERGVLLRNGQPIMRRNGTYKVRGPGIGIKIPGYHGIEKVNVQEQSQRLPDIIAECADGQYRLEIDLVFKFLCEEDNPLFKDFPALTVIKTKEPAQVFISRCGRAARMAIESCSSSAQRNDSSRLLKKTNAVVGRKLHKRGLKLLEVNIISCSRTPIQVAADKFGPSEPSNVAALPHPIVTTTAFNEGVA